MPRPEPPVPARNVPGSGGPGAGAGAPNKPARGGRYPSRGAPRNVYRGDGEERGPRNTGPVPESGDAEGMESPGGFDGERVGEWVGSGLGFQWHGWLWVVSRVLDASLALVDCLVVHSLWTGMASLMLGLAPPKRAHHGPDKHTKPPGGTVLTSGGHRSRGSGHVRGAKTPAFGAERRQFERRSGGIPDSQKKVDQGWGPNQGEAELTGEYGTPAFFGALFCCWCFGSEADGT